MTGSREVMLVKEMLREQLCCLGRIFVRHEVPDDVIWEVVKGFDVIYEETREKIENSSDSDETAPQIPKLKPHPGLMYLLDKIGK